MELSNITVVRKKSDIDWMLSEFFFDAAVKGVGVEDERRSVKIKGETAIPDGIYKLGLHYPSKFSPYYFRDDEGNLIWHKDRNTPEEIERYHTQHEMIHVLDVPNFQYVLWHWGNTDDDTEGCYIVGDTFGPIGTQKGVLNSKKKYVEIYPIIWRAIRDGKKIGKNVTVLYR